MIRSTWLVLSAFCVVVFLSEILGAALLWSQGQLTTRRLREMRDLFGQQEKEAVAAEAEPQRVLPSAQDVLRERSLRVLSLSSLETEIGLLKTMIESERNSLTTQLADFQRQKEAFKKQLQQLSDETTVAAREQSRAVLLAMPPTDAVERLMQVTVEEDVLLMREMPEPKIALILKEFAAMPEGRADNAAVPKEVQAKQQRGEDIFKRLTKGEPRDSMIRATLNQVQQGEAERLAAAAK